MIRTQIQLTEQQAHALKDLAGREGVSMAELIRRAVTQIINESDEDEKWRRARALAGRYRSTVSDLGERHDDYLDEAYS